MKKIGGGVEEDKKDYTEWYLTILEIIKECNEIYEDFVAIESDETVIKTEQENESIKEEIAITKMNLEMADTFKNSVESALKDLGVNITDLEAKFKSEGQVPTTSSVGVGPDGEVRPLTSHASVGTSDNSEKSGRVDESSQSQAGVLIPTITKGTSTAENAAVNAYEVAKTGGYLNLLENFKSTESSLDWDRYYDILKAMNKICLRHALFKIINLENDDDDDLDDELKSDSKPFIELIKKADFPQTIKSDDEETMLNFWKPRAQLINSFFQTVSILSEAFSKYKNLSIGTPLENPLKTNENQEFKKVFIDDLSEIEWDLKIKNPSDKDHPITPNRQHFIMSLLNFFYLNRKKLESFYNDLLSSLSPLRADNYTSKYSDFEAKMNLLKSNGLSEIISTYFNNGYDLISIDDVIDIIKKILGINGYINHESIFKYNAQQQGTVRTTLISNIINFIETVIFNIENISDLVKKIDNADSEKHPEPGAKFFKDLISRIIKLRNESTVITYIKFRNDETIPIGGDPSKLPRTNPPLKLINSQITLETISSYSGIDNKDLYKPKYNKRFDIKLNVNTQSPNILDTILLKYNDDNIPYYKYDAFNKKFTFSPEIRDLVTENNEKFKGTVLDSPDENANLKVEKYDKQYVFGKFTKVFLPYMDNAAAADEMDSICNCLANNKTVFLLGYGASGAGKTSSLVYFKNTEEPGILIHLCEKICKDKERFDIEQIEVCSQEFYVDHMDLKKREGIIETSTRTKELQTPTIKRFPPLRDGVSYKDREYVVFKYDNVSKRIELDYDKFEYNPIHAYRADKPNFITKSKAVNGLNATTLGELMIHLIDSDRFVKATTNNPNSSRSHTLIYIRFKKVKSITATTSKKSKPSTEDEYFTFVVGDFAGVENSFICDSKITQKRFATVRRDIRDTDITFYGTEPIADVSELSETDSLARDVRLPGADGNVDRRREIAKKAIENAIKASKVGGTTVPGSRFKDDICTTDNYKYITETQKLYNFEDDVFLLRNNDNFKSLVGLIGDFVDDLENSNRKNPDPEAVERVKTARKTLTLYLNIIINCIFKDMTATKILELPTPKMRSELEKETIKTDIQTVLQSLLKFKSELESNLSIEFIEKLVKKTPDNDTYSYEKYKKELVPQYIAESESMADKFEILKDKITTNDDTFSWSITEKDGKVTNFNGGLIKYITDKLGIYRDKKYFGIKTNENENTPLESGKEFITVDGDNKLISNGIDNSLIDIYNKKIDEINTNISVLETTLDQTRSKLKTKISNMKFKKRVTSFTLDNEINCYSYIEENDTFKDNKPLQNYRGGREDNFDNACVIKPTTTWEWVGGQRRSVTDETNIKSFTDAKSALNTAKSNRANLINIAKNSFNTDRNKELDNFNKYHQKLIVDFYGDVFKITSKNKIPGSNKPYADDYVTTIIGKSLEAEKEKLIKRSEEIDKFWNSIKDFQQPSDMNNADYSSISKTPLLLESDKIEVWDMIKKALKDKVTSLLQIIKTVTSSKNLNIDETKLDDYFYIYKIIAFDVDENILTKTDEFLDSLLNLTKDLFIETSCRMEQAKYVCENRLIEGYFINDSLKKMRKDIQTILYNKNKILKVSLEPDYVNICEKFYCKRPTQESNKCREITESDDGLQSVIFREICKEAFEGFTATGGIDVAAQNKLYEKLVMAVLCVVNISRDTSDVTNNPPPIPYVDINKLYYMINMYKIFSSHESKSIFKTVFTEMINKIEGVYKERLASLITTIDYKKGKAAIFSINNLSLDAGENITYSEGIVKLEDMKRLNIIKILRDDKVDIVDNSPFDINFKSESEEDKKKFYASAAFSDIVNCLVAIDNSNAASTIGTLEFVDRLAKFNTSNTVCGKDIVFDADDVTYTEERFTRMEDSRLIDFKDIIDACPIIADYQNNIKGRKPHVDGGKLGIKNKKITKITSKKTKTKTTKKDKPTKETKSSSSVEKKKKKTKNTK